MGGFVAAEIEHLRSVPQAALLRGSPRIGTISASALERVDS